MALRDKGGGCHEQTRVQCAHPSRSAFLALPSSTAQGRLPELPQVSDRCAAMPCNVDSTQFRLSLVRVVLAAALGPRPKAKNVAIVGLGGGMIPMWIRQKRPEINVEAADINAGVVASVHCFGVFNGTGMQVFRQDGREFLQRQPEGKYNAVIVDAFDDTDTIPKCLRTVEFFRMVRSRLAAKGGLVINTWRKNVDVMLPALQLVFPKVVIAKCPGLGNLIVHATSKDVILPETPAQEEDDDFWENKPAEDDHFFQQTKSKAHPPLTVAGDDPAQWLASANFMHPPKGWAIFPQYHQNGAKPSSTAPTVNPLYVDYTPPHAESDEEHACKYAI
jgi:hypothetical protein